MRTRIVLSVLLVLVAAFFFLIKPKAKENNIQPAPGSDAFKIGAFDNGWMKNDYNNIKDLGLNLWHKYSEVDNGWQNNIQVSNDILESKDGGAYTGNVNTKIGTNYSNGFLTMLDRCKINYLGLAKRSVYECEADSNHYPDKDYWFYGYWIHNSNTSNEYQDNSSFGGGIYTRHSSPSLGHKAGYVVNSLKSNREQLWMRESALQNLKLYILPRIRIEPAGYNNLDTTRVCRIEILKSDGSEAKSVILRKSNFARKDFTYNGEYVDKYKFNPANQEDPEPITINSIADLNVNGYWIDDQRSKVDYRVWWYGQCEMWLDNITVENEIAYDFFGDNPNKLRYNTFQQWLDWEVKDIANANTDKIFNFYFDEPEFCSLPALIKINREIKARGGTNIRVVPCIMYYMLKSHIPDFKHYQIPDDKLKKYVFDSLDITYFYFDNYPFNGAKFWTGEPMSKIPSTLKNAQYSDAEGILAESVSPAVYETWLQNFLDDDDFSYDRTPFFTGFLKKVNSMYKQYNITFIPAIQTHLNNAIDGKLKEPSNEEISLLTNLALSYGAKGLIYAAYLGYGQLPVPSGQNPGYSRGLVDNLDVKRINNVYGQPKWEEIKKNIGKTKVWGPLLMSFNNESTNSYIYRIADERNSLLNNSYFSRIITLHQGSVQANCSDGFTPQNIPEGYIYECQNNTYLQVATFENSEPNTKYFMVVNRRCSPYINDNSDDNIGGRRKVRMYLKSDYPAFSSSGSWKIIDCENENVAAVFNKSNPGFIELNWFMPGEGKLYKIVPGS